MDRVAVFVDAGYLFAAGSKILAGRTLTRRELSLDHSKVLEALTNLATGQSRLPLLRIYWYDGTSSGPTPQQLALARCPSVKLRLGLVNQHGQQKGVDSLIITDLITLARNRAMADAVLLTGDEDIRVGVQQAQEFGVRVHLVGIQPARENQSGLLVQEADTTLEISSENVQSFLSRSAMSSPSAELLSSAPPLGAESASMEPGGDDSATSVAPMVLDDAARRIASGLSPEEKDAVLQFGVGGSVPSEIDRRLLKAGSDAIGGQQLTSPQKRQLRRAFRDACEPSQQ